MAGALCANGAMRFVVVRVPPVCCASVWLRTCTACIIMVAGPRVVGSASCMYRSHFDSRYKLGCCGHAGFFVAPCVAVVLLRLFGLVLRFCRLALPRGRCAAAGVGVMTRARRLATCVVLGGAWFLCFVGCCAESCCSVGCGRCWQPLASRLPQEKYCYG